MIIQEKNVKKALQNYSLKLKLSWKSVYKITNIKNKVWKINNKNNLNRKIVSSNYLKKK